MVDYLELLVGTSTLTLHPQNLMVHSYPIAKKTATERENNINQVIVLTIHIPSNGIMLSGKIVHVCPPFS